MKTKTKTKESAGDRVLAMVNELEEIGLKLAAIREREGAIAVEKACLKARAIAILEALGVDRLDTLAGSLSLRRKPAELSLAMSDLEFARAYPELCKPDPSAIRTARSKRPELWDIAIDDRPDGHQISFKAS